MMQEQSPGLPPRAKDRCAGAGLSVGDYSTRTATRQPAWVASKCWADSAWPGVVTLFKSLGFGNPTPSTQALDWCGVDFTTSDGLRWAWRNRSACYFGFHDVTLRVSRPSGTATERAKLQGGAVDRLLWTWSDGGKVVAWLVLDADRLRPLLARSWPSVQMGDATFCAVPWQALHTAGAVVSCSPAIRAVLHG